MLLMIQSPNFGSILGVKYKGEEISSRNRESHVKNNFFDSLAIQKKNELKIFFIESKS